MSAVRLSAEGDFLYKQIQDLRKLFNALEKRIKEILPKLTIRNQHSFFGKNVKHGELFSYSDSFLLRDVRHLAKKQGYWIDYCKPGSLPYKMHGSQVCYAHEIEKAAEEMEAASFPNKLIEKISELRNMLKVFDIFLFELRTMAEEIEEIADSFDDGVEGIEDALRTIQDALDDISDFCSFMSRYV